MHDDGMAPNCAEESIGDRRGRRKAAILPSRVLQRSCLACLIYRCWRFDMDFPGWLPQVPTRQTGFL